MRNRTIPLSVFESYLHVTSKRGMCTVKCQGSWFRNSLTRERSVLEIRCTVPTVSLQEQTMLVIRFSLPVPIATLISDTCAFLSIQVSCKINLIHSQMTRGIYCNHRLRDAHAVENRISRAAPGIDWRSVPNCPLPRTQTLLVGIEEAGCGLLTVIRLCCRTTTASLLSL